MFAQEPCKIASMKISLGYEPELDRVEVRATAVELRLGPQIGDAAERKFPLWPHEHQLDGIQFLRKYAHPRLPLPARHDRDRQMAVPKELSGWCGGLQDFE